MFAIEDVSFSYHKPLMEHLTFQIHPGDVVCLMGANGGGKSTLLNMLAGFQEPQQGQIFFRDHSLNEWLQMNQTKKEYHQQVGVLFQQVDTQLFNTSVYDEIAFGPRQLALAEDEVKQRVSDCLDLLDITALSERVPYHLSGGEKRKVALASVLSLNPEVLLLDEPFEGLTQEAQQQFITLFKQLNQAGKTLILASHNYRHVKELATAYLIFLGDGKIRYLTRAEVEADPEMVSYLEKM